MKLLGSFSDPRAVQGAVDYLKTLGIDSQLHSEDGRNVSVWVNDRDWQRADTVWQEFLANPYHEKYSKASWQVGATDSGLQYHSAKLNLLQRFFHLNWFIQSIVIISLLVYGSYYYFTPAEVFNALKFDTNLPLSWITPTFMHFGAIHLLFNLSWWLYLGNQIVQRTDFVILITVFTVSALLSNWAQFLLVDENFGGLSGVVYAQMGFCWVLPQLNKDQQPILSTPIIGFMLLWMILGFADVLFISMANWAHLFGLLSGMSLAVLAQRLSGKGT
ncbi:rhomboid family intramembrane serine protease GlpG [Pseudoalteromonas obscura]|uniref:Rhomboid family intramembrane serine protease GlpG n=1 Tax=Pseudoalteromonas obscura TaxID=3048491 RepID=A0ABT7ENB0_9GAMM|nr:rhomboid family intramembrane serine protease GlpG [Pseudoalteromonas sp. P94(2023)]MDK2596535.1 rhomboid family intramembrane serine protease GlpG [Pseudoalteromonas sp. P94(2023)]